MAIQKRSRVFSRAVLAVALCACLANVAHSQSTSTTVYGTVQGQAGDTVEIRGNTGVVREVPVDSQGRYRVAQLPLDTYTITLKKGGQVVDTRADVTPNVGGGAEVSFGAGSAAAPVTSETQDLEAVTVTANQVPSIDVSSVDSRTVVTSRDLEVLPLSRSAEAIAMLTPGAVAGSNNFTNGSYRTVSLGGAGVTENAYYINGFNVTDPLSGIGGLGLPYNVIAQQETYSGGYSAMYGRSNGGVLSQVGKRGTNDWQFGGQATWKPRALAETPKNVFYPNRALPPGYEYELSEVPGTKYRDRKDNNGWNTTYSVYAGGPIVPDKLFVFLAAEMEKSEDKSTNSVSSSTQGRISSQTSVPKFYGKLDWNINNNNQLELTAIKNSDRYSGDIYSYDYDTGQVGEQVGVVQGTKLATDLYIGKYTSYITDDLTLTALYGENKTRNFNTASMSSNPRLSGTTSQDPAITGESPIRNDQTIAYVQDPRANTKTRGYRVDLAYQLQDHLLSVGVDNMYYRSYFQGDYQPGPAYWWIYGRGNPGQPINDALGVGAPGGQGYYVSQYIFDTRTSMSVDQEAYYLEDAWQVTENFLLKLGVRNDKFINKNNLGAAYIKQDNQWAPRIGFSWDVNGDSSLKLFGNAGRYYLALPPSVAIRGASASTYTNEYFTYTGIDSIGVPTGLTPLGPGPVSANGEYGVPPDPNTVTAKDIDAQYQDEYILGLDAKISENWVAGIKGTYRSLGSAIDDVCDAGTLADKIDAGGDDSSLYDIRGCYIFNPGQSNTFQINRLDGSGSTSVRMTNQDWGFTEKAKRDYYAVDLYLERPFDGKWSARFDYTFSRSWGNTEGQVKSDIGQTDVSKTQDWDAGRMMDYASGVLANNRRHQLRARGTYQVAPEWLLSGLFFAQSGSPKSCIGYYGVPGDDRDPIGYGAAYHWCNGQPSAPGAPGDNPWLIRLDLGVTYRPAFANDRLAFGIDVINALDRREATQTETVYENDVDIVNNTYGMGTFFQEPRYVRFSVSYDF